MDTININHFAEQVLKMRLLQNAYFKYKSHATRSKRPADFEAAAAALIEAKTQETVVDKLIEDITKSDVTK